MPNGNAIAWRMLEIYFGLRVFHVETYFTNTKTQKTKLIASPWG